MAIHFNPVPSHSNVRKKHLSNLSSGLDKTRKVAVKNSDRDDGRKISRTFAMMRAALRKVQQVDPAVLQRFKKVIGPQQTSTTSMSTVGLF